jgi:hypothetical protein
MIRKVRHLVRINNDPSAPKPGVRPPEEPCLANGRGRQIKLESFPPTPAPLRYGGLRGAGSRSQRCRRVTFPLCTISDISTCNICCGACEHWSDLISAKYPSSFGAIASAVHGSLAKYRAAAFTQVSNTSSASKPRVLPSVGRKTGYPPLWTAPTIMRLSGR